MSGLDAITNICKCTINTNQVLYANFHFSSQNSE